MSIDYTQEKLYQAVNCLISDGSIQSRLSYAAEYLLRLQGGDPAFPEHRDLQERLGKVLHDLASSPAIGDEGTIKATTRALSDEAGAKIAGEIFGLFCSATDLAAIPVGFEPRRPRQRGSGS